MNFAQRLIMKKEKEDLFLKWGQLVGGSEAANIVAFRRSLSLPVLNGGEDAIFLREEDQAFAFRKAIATHSLDKKKGQKRQDESLRPSLAKGVAQAQGD